MSITCAVCTAPTTANLCKACTGELTRAIAELPADLTDLQLVATRQANGPLGLGIGRQWDGPASPGALGDAPWVFAPGASDQVWALNNTVTTWVRHLCESRRAPMPDASTPLIAWLLTNVEAIRHDEAAEQIFDELTGLHAENEKWILGRSGVEVFAGNCDATQVGFGLDDAGTLVPVAARCGVALYGREGESHVRCDACGTRYPLQERLDEIRGMQINDQLARAHTIADALTTLDEPLGRDLLRKWIQRDSLRGPAPYGPACERCRHVTCRQVRRPPILAQDVDADGHPLYRFGDVRRRLQLVQEQRGVRLSA